MPMSLYFTAYTYICTVVIYCQWGRHENSLLETLWVTEFCIATIQRRVKTAQEMCAHHLKKKKIWVNFITSNTIFVTHELFGLISFCSFYKNLYNPSLSINTLSLSKLTIMQVQFKKRWVRNSYFFRYFSVLPLMQCSVLYQSLSLTQMTLQKLLR